MTDKVQGFSGNPRLEFLYLKCKWWHYSIPDRYFNGDNAYVMEQLTYTDSVGYVHTVKKGLIIDGGSLPHIGFVLKWIGTPYTKYLLAYLVHDEECKEARDIARMAQLRPTDEKELMKLSRQRRKDADATFREMLKWLNDNLPEVDCGKAKRGLMWLGVRLGWIGSFVMRKETMEREVMVKEKTDVT